MPIRIGFYDFFSYTVPGAFYLIVFTYAAAVFGVVRVDLATLNNLSLFATLVFAGASNITGILMDVLTRPWAMLFRRNDLPGLALDRFKRGNPNLKVDFETNDYGVLLSQLNLRSHEVAAITEHHNAMNVMMRNIGFGLLLLAFVFVAFYAFVSPNYCNLLVALGCLAFSTIAGRKSVVYAMWFYSSIYSAAAAESLRSQNWVTLQQPSRSTPAQQNNTDFSQHKPEKPVDSDQIA